MFILKNVTYKDILHIPYLQIQKETITCIIGESGSGKSTLLRMLNDLQSPTSGTIEYNGKPISDYPPIQLRRDVVMLGQTPPIFDGTVKDNLLMGLRLSEKPSPSDDTLQNALTTVSLNKNLEDNAASLSGGEKQRLAFARIILMDPPVYLLDEPTSALDSDTERRVMKQFTILAREKKKPLSSSRTRNNFQKKLQTILLKLVKQTVQLERECSQLKGVIELQIWQLAAAYIFILILIGLVRLKGIPREKQIAIATFRMTIQLVLVAYVLTYIFENSNPFYTIALITSITTFAIFNIYKRVNIPMSKELKRVAALSMVADQSDHYYYLSLLLSGIIRGMHRNISFLLPAC